MSLPIHSSLDGLRLALRSSPTVLLSAPPGAGKTTVVPPALLQEPWLEGRRIVMLEPRRLAARAAAARIAASFGEAVGGTVGYRMRMDTRVGRSTRIEVVTEGVLTRMLQEDPSLEHVGAVIFDEFHERSLHADLGLALTLQAQSILRPELRILVMSATLEFAPILALLGDVPVIESHGRMFPVETRYVARDRSERIERATAAVVARALREADGDLLAFLPGAGEIRRTAALLEEANPDGVDILPLFGTLPPEEQDRAIAPSVPGRRKAVLATSIAETSLTIDGVRVIVDSGLTRRPRFSPRTGMSRLQTVRVSRASAEQRCGRAGRLAPGVCYRLWEASENPGLLDHTPPEILEADLASLALDLAEWGVADPSELRWIDPPPTAAFQQGRELLGELGALDPSGAIAPHGRRMASLPMHPRLAHMVLMAGSIDAAVRACDIAALLNERDFLRSDRPIAPDPDIRLRLDVLDAVRRSSGAAPAGHTVDRAVARRVIAQSDAWARRIGAGADDPDADVTGLLLSFAYPDRIARARGGGRYLLRNGVGARLSEAGMLSGSEWIVAAEVDGARGQNRVLLAAPIAVDRVEQYFGDQFETENVVEWNSESNSVRAIARRRIGAILLDERPIAHPERDRVVTAIIDAIEQSGLQLLQWSREAVRLRERMEFLHRLDERWPAVSDRVLIESISIWLTPALMSQPGRPDPSRVDVVSALRGLLDWRRSAELDVLAPTHLEVPSGSRIPIDYSDPAAPVLAVRLQEMFGQTTTPRIAAGRVPLTIHLLSPAHRPVQVTQDLESFWRTTYYEVRKDLKGRYPKHYWPDDPLAAPPTARAKRRK